jgi:hypothetical protein
MNHDQRKALLQVEQIIELELQEMRQFLPNRFARLQNAVSQVQTIDMFVEEETMEDTEYETVMTSHFLSGLLEDLPPYVSNKQTAQA